MDTGNYVAKLHDYSQKTGSQLYYKFVDAVGPDHNKTFTQRVVFNGVEYPDGVGRSKKEAKQDAAKNALTCLMRNQPDSAEATDNGAEASSASGNQMMSNFNYNQHVQQNRAESTIPEPNNTIINKTKCLNVKSQDNSFMETNFIGLVNHYCQVKDLHHEFTDVRMCGPPHNPLFYCKLVIDMKEYPEGEGKTKMKAKQHAAQLAWSALQEQSDWDSKVSLRSTASEDSAPTTTSEFNESSSHVMPVSTSDSIVFEDSSNHPEAQSMELSVSDTPTRSRESLEPSNPAMDISHCVQDSSRDQSMELSVSDTPTHSRFTSEFESIERLGKGGFGCVYKVKEKLLNMYYAVKIVKYNEKALREVTALSDLSHQHIVRYYSCWLEDSLYKDEITDSVSSDSVSNASPPYLYIKMELCDTKTLRDWINKRNKVTEPDSKRREDSLTIAQQIVLGVEYIHSKNLIHRDLKPENIMLGRDKARQVKIGDFGLVTAENHADDGKLLTRTKAGTKSYMAPEQKNKNPTYDHKVDIFALGLIYFELLWKISTGHEKVVIWEEIKHQKFPKAFMDSFFQEGQQIKLMLCKEPENRPEASSLKVELEKWAQQNKVLKNITV